MAINARMHTLHVRRKDGTLTDVASYPRSGAFAMHGRLPKGVGLSTLLAASEQLAQQVRWVSVVVTGRCRQLQVGASWLAATKLLVQN